MISTTRRLALVAVASQVAGHGQFQVEHVVIGFDAAITATDGFGLGRMQNG